MSSSPPKKRKLTPKEEFFVAEFIIDLNATRSAKAAGYSEKTARQLASRLLSKVYIQEAIQQAKIERMKRTEINADFTLKRLAWLANASIFNVAQWGTRESTKWIKDRDGEFKEIKEEGPYLNFFDSEVVGKKKAFGIDSIKIQASEFGNTISLKMRNPVQALDLLGQHQGLFEVGANDSIPDALAEANKELDALEQNKSEPKPGKARPSTVTPARGADHQTEFQDQEQSDSLARESSGVPDESEDV